MLNEKTLSQAVHLFELTEHVDRLDDRQRDASLGLLVMVIGAGNFGKSSLINALCGRTVAPVSVLPKTFKIDVFAAGKSGSALVRNVGETKPTSVSFDEARRIEAERERQFKDDNERKLAEIVWLYDDLELPSGISLVDTPGISQGLGIGAKGIALTSVLGSTFEVDEVWSKWFHRADVVIWAFCANKMEDADTREALEAALKLFDKPILPVATKADLIPQDRWPEVVARFEAAYGYLLRDRQAGELQLTVCAGKNPELVGFGISELRRRLAKVAAKAEIVKSSADEAFLRDESVAVSQVLDETAKALVANLRSIASLGDFLAEEARKEAERGRVDAVSRVNVYLESVRRDPRLELAARSVHEVTQGGRSGNVEVEAGEQLRGLIDEHRIEREVNSAFASSAKALEATADRLAQGMDVTTLNFKSSGKIDKRSVPLKLKLRAFSVTSKLDFSMQLKAPTGILAQAWDLIKRLLKVDRFTVKDIHAAMASALDIPTSDLVAARDQALREGLAPSIQAAIESALIAHIESTDREALNLLKKVDEFLPELDAPGAPIRATTYGPQADYWATLSPDAETLLGLAKSEFTRTIPALRTLLSEPISYESPRVFPEFRQFWDDRTVDRKAVSVSIRLKDLVAGAKVRDRFDEHGNDVSQDVPLLPQVLEAQQIFLQGSKAIIDLDRRLGASVIGARYQSAGRQLSEVAVSLLQNALADSSRQWVESVRHERIGHWVCGQGTLIGSIAFLVITLVLIIIQPIAGLLALLCSIGWFGLGFARPYLTALSRYQNGVAEQVEAEILQCQRDAAARLDSHIIDDVLHGMSVELAPRPLQQLLLEFGLLEI